MDGELLANVGTLHIAVGAIGLLGHRQRHGKYAYTQ
jgi:hypothetical protein